MSELICVNVDDGSVRKLDENYKISKNFTIGEFKSRDCEVVLYSQRHINILQAIRDWYNKPVRITSGFRSPSHNDDVSDFDLSNHQFGDTTDFTVDGEKSENVKLVASKIAGYLSQIITYYNTNHTHLATKYPHKRLYYNGDRYIIEDY